MNEFGECIDYPQVVFYKLGVSGPYNKVTALP